VVVVVGAARGTGADVADAGAVAVAVGIFSSFP